MRQDEQIKREFGRALRSVRTKAGLSQERLAAKAGLNRTYVGDVERRERNISIVNMRKLAVALGVSLSALIREMESRRG